jgi:hypothetical protein
MEERMKLKVYVVDFEIPPRAKKWALRLGIPAVVISGAAAAFALPVTFTDGQTLKAADLNNNFGYLVPSGAVVAFNLQKCPTGWTAMAQAGGRTIVGVNSAGGNGLSQRNLGDTPGEETHTLSIAEMPSHSHTSVIYATVGTSFTNGTTGLQIQGGTSVATNLGESIPSNAAGGGNAFPIMQPSIALLYCQKD